MIDQQQRLSITMMIRSIMCVLTLYGLTAILLAGCATKPPGTLEGSAIYRERIALPLDAVFEAELLEESVADAQAAVLGRAAINPAGQRPLHFRIAYDETAVQPGRRYVVRATVKNQDRLLFTTDQAYPALVGEGIPLKMMLISAGAGKQPEDLEDLPASYEREMPGANSLMLWHLDLLPEGRYQLRTTYLDKPEPNRFDKLGRWRYDRDNGRLELLSGAEPSLYFTVEPDGSVLHKLDANGKPFASPHNEPLQRLTKPALIEPRLKLTGMFTYMADAATITLCEDGRRLPVAMEADYKALERAYVKADPQPRQAPLVTLEGVIASRPSMEESQPPRPTLVVERFVNILPRETCGQPLAESPLRGTYWKLVRLNGEPVEAAESQQEPHLIFASDQLSVSGSGGCNRVMGSFQLDGDKLHLGQMAGTMMACMKGMEQEQRFLQTLNKAERYCISGSHLEMLDAAGTGIARFEAVALR
jgi:copper homeostasis protein (lipoprotein)